MGESLLFDKSLKSFGKMRFCFDKSSNSFDKERFCFDKFSKYFYGNKNAKKYQKGSVLTKNSCE